MTEEADRDKSLLLAANALYLNRINFQIEYHATPPGCRDHLRELDSDDFMSFDRLRSFILWPGIIDDRILSPFEPFGTFPWYDDRLKSLLLSDAEITQPDVWKLS